MQYVAAFACASNRTSIPCIVPRTPHTAVLACLRLQIEFTDINKAPGIPARTKLLDEEPKAALPKEKKLELPLLSRMS
jgi:hypothetical protein